MAQWIEYWLYDIAAAKRLDYLMGAKGSVESRTPWSINKGSSLPWSENQMVRGFVVVCFFLSLYLNSDSDGSYCPLDRIYNYLEDTLLSKPVVELLGCVKWDGKTHSKYRWHHPLGWDPGPNQKENVNQDSSLSVSLLSYENALWSAPPSSCDQDFLPCAGFP